jgi:hypothetical protein
VHFYYLAGCALSGAQSKGGQKPGMHPSGLSAVQGAEAIRVIKEHLEIVSATISAFDPRYDVHGKTLRAGLEQIPC